MENIMIGLLIGAVLFVIYLFIKPKSKEKKNNYTNDDELDLLITICTSNVHFGQPPLKVTSLFDDDDIKNNFNSIGHYLLAGKYPKDKTIPNIFVFNVELESDKKNVREITISINSDSLASYSESVSDDEPYQNSESLEDILLDLDEYDENDDSIELPIRGINFRNLNDTNIGSFSGYIAPDKENKFDKYAIGVYSQDGTHFGYIEKDQKYFYDFIESKGGYIDAVLDISTFIDDDTGKTRFHGIVAIDKANLV